MDTRSKVWPALVKSSLDLNPSLGRSSSFQRFSHKKEESNDRFLGGGDQLCEWCNSSANLSDVLCVTGGITTVTGSLIAAFGVFPKNQARIRLYLECVGCAMVIVGVLIVFAGLKMRPTSSSAAARGAQESDPLDDWFGFEQETSAGYEHQSPERSMRPISEEVRIKFGSKVVPRLGDNLSGEIALRDMSPVSLVVNNHWAPYDDDVYGDDHQAAIEAALSTVLTVSTLVGFRSENQVHGRQHCCLHHAVQHTINAMKWIKRLRISRQSINGRRSADTTLTESSSKAKDRKGPTTTTTSLIVTGLNNGVSNRTD